MNKIRGPLFLACFLAPHLAMTQIPAAFGAPLEYYVAPNGHVRGDGSLQGPWPSVQHALSRVGGGKCIILLPGTYGGPIQLSNLHRGTRETPTVIRSSRKWKANVLGSSRHCIVIDSDCPWVLLDGLEVSGARYTGIKTDANDTTIANCWIHHNAMQGVEAHAVNTFRLVGNLVEYNGSNPQWDHGVYADGKDHLYQSNVVRHNSSHGLHLYPGLTGSTIAGNLIYENVGRQILVSLPSDPAKAEPDTIVNNTCVGGQIGIGVMGGTSQPPTRIMNNICSQATIGPILLQWGNANVYVDHNLLQRLPTEKELPPSMIGRHNTITARPGFLEETQGVFWLAPDSPARGAGIQTSMIPGGGPVTDLFGSVCTSLKCDAGAFFYRDELVRRKRRPFDQYRGEPDGPLPEIWSAGTPYSAPGPAPAR